MRRPATRSGRRSPRSTSPHRSRRAAATAKATPRPSSLIRPPAAPGSAPSCTRVPRAGRLAAARPRRHPRACGRGGQARPAGRRPPARARRRASSPRTTPGPGCGTTSARATLTQADRPTSLPRPAPPAATARTTACHMAGIADVFAGPALPTTPAGYHERLRDPLLTAEAVRGFLSGSITCGPPRRRRRRRHVVVDHKTNHRPHYGEPSPPTTARGARVA